MPGTLRPLRVLWITTGATSDGPGRTLSALLAHWPSVDNVAVCALRDVSPEFRAAVPARIETMALGMRGPLDVRAAFAVANLCRTWRPDVIHTQLSRADWIGRTVGAACGVPVVSTIQNVHSKMYAAEFSWLMTRLGWWLDRMTSPLASRFIAVSNGVRADLEQAGVPHDRIDVIHNGFEPGRARLSSDRAAARAMLKCDADTIVVGTVALLKVQKGIRDLVEAARLVVARDPRVRFVQMGDGPLEHDARRWVAEAGLTDRLLLLDRVADPMTLLPGVDIFVLPSLWEGLPIALLEAMAAGLPAVGTRVSGIEEVIVDGVTGRLVPPADPPSLARAILELANAPTLRASFGDRARARLELFDARAIAAEYRRVYLNVLGAPQVAARRAPVPLG